MPRKRIVMAMLCGAAASVAPIALRPASGDVASEMRDTDWPHYGGADENHFSPLTQINDKTVGKLGLAWSYDIGTGGSSLSAPVEVGGTLYFAAGQSVIHALDAKTGKLLWQYDPEVGQVAGDKLRGGWGVRGIAYDNGRIFTGTMDGRLIALDARGGRRVWSAMTVDKADGRYITGAPWVFDGKVMIGHGGADFAAVRGYVTAYDQATGKQLWRFYTVPGEPAKGFENDAMAMAAKTWKGQWWKYGGGGTVWNAMAYDPKYHRVYIGTGNGTPWNQKIRSPGGGDNLFLCSIIALDADTGKYLWHYQVNPGETWDYNAAMDIELADLRIDGKLRPVILQAPKNGFFYVIDRETGKLISTGQIAPQNWAKGIDPQTGRPIENPEARYPDGKPALVYPSGSGAHSIEAMAFNGGTGLVYIPTIDKGAVYSDPAEGVANWTMKPGEQLNPGIGPGPRDLVPRAPTSTLLAWDPVRQKEAWHVTLPGTRSFGGLATTAGNLVLGGTVEGRFVAYAADSGRELWAFDAKSAIMAQSIVYSTAGRQYVSVIAGARYLDPTGAPRRWDYRGQQWRVLTFALGGTAKLPDTTPPAPRIEPDPGFVPDPAKVAKGTALYNEHCMVCHGGRAISGGTAPSLLSSPIVRDDAAFRSVLHDGALTMNGMPRFGELSEDQIDALGHYVRSRAQEERGH